MNFYYRETDLPKLIDINATDLNDYTANGYRRVISKLDDALKIEDQRKQAGHPQYDPVGREVLVDASLAEHQSFIGLLEDA